MYNLKYTKDFEKGLKRLSKAEQKATAQKLKILVAVTPNGGVANDRL